jgi:hypothetical protein
MELWHGTSSALFPESGAPRVIQAPCVHGSLTFWPELVAPRSLVYLGDSVALIFGSHACSQVGGDLLLLKVQVDPNVVEPDPAYLKVREKFDNLKPEWDHSLRWCGRVATPGPVHVSAAWKCNDLHSLRANMISSGLAQHAQSWHDEQTMAEFCSKQSFRRELGGGLPRSHWVKLYPVLL